VQDAILPLVFDHLLIDGAPAAYFLQMIKALIEDPALSIMYVTVSQNEEMGQSFKWNFGRGNQKIRRLYLTQNVQQLPSILLICSSPYRIGSRRLRAAYALLRNL